MKAATAMPDWLGAENSAEQPGPLSFNAASAACPFLVGILRGRHGAGIC
jgi:hypothetical protein